MCQIKRKKINDDIFSLKNRTALQHGSLPSAVAENLVRRSGLLKEVVLLAKTFRAILCAKIKV